MRLPRQIVVAGATVVVAATVSHSVLPGSSHYRDPVGSEQRSEQQYGDYRKRELEEARLKADREGEAIRLDALRPAEVRPAEKEAADVVRLLLRRP